MAIPEWKNNLLADLLDRKSSLAVLGLGYTGLPLALAFGNRMQVTAFDIDPQKIMRLRQGIDPAGELPAQLFANISVDFTCYPEVLARSRVFIICVPTPVDEHHVPVLDELISASESIGKGLKRGDLVIYESTVYPGCTEEVCIPVLEKTSGLKVSVDFKVGFSPERINPGDREHTLVNTTKVIAGCDEEASKTIAALYRQIIKAGIHPVSSIKVAETAKIIENTQRDLNVALMNELSMICNRLGINTYEVLEAAGTKWNFNTFTPGLAGGHGIVSDPYHLAHKAMKTGYSSQLIPSTRRINESMASWLAGEVIRLMLNHNLDVKQVRVLVMGFTYKENVTDITNTGVARLVRELQSYRLDITVTDPLADAKAVLREYGIVVEKNDMKVKNLIREEREEREDIKDLKGVEGVRGVENVEESRGLWSANPDNPDNPDNHDNYDNHNNNHNSQPITHNGFSCLFDVVIVAVAHKEYVKMDEAALGRWLKPGGILVDLKGIFRGRIHNFEYWSL